MITDNNGEEVLLVVAEDEGDAGDFFNLGGGHLGETSHDDDLGVGIGAVGLADGGAAFLFGDGGDGAGVDDVQVGRLMKINDCVALVGKTAQMVGRLGVVELASKGVGGYYHFF